MKPILPEGYFWHGRLLVMETERMDGHKVVELVAISADDDRLAELMRELVRMAMVSGRNGEAIP